MPCNNLHVVVSGIPSGMQVLCGTMCSMSFFVLDGCPRAPARFDYFVFDPVGETIWRFFMQRPLYSLEVAEVSLSCPCVHLLDGLLCTCGIGLLAVATSW